MADEQDRERTNGSTPESDDPSATDPTANDPTANDPAADDPTTEPFSAPDDDEVRAKESAEALTEPVDETDDDDPDGDADGDRELATVGAPSKQRTSSAGNGNGSAKGAEVATGKERTKKDKATPKQRQAEVKTKRTTPAQFVREAVGELRKVVYPTGSQLANYFVVVLVFVLFIIGIVSLLDLGLGWVIFKIFA